MVFSSVPLYLDPPNWQQHPDPHHQGGANENQNPHLPPAPANQPGGALVMGGPTTASTIRPNSMSERARLAKIPLPEGPLKCPRCESTHTKFCYFNNYSLSQPRHFCKTCRRYWTRGGALRSVPVGGGCRRNKRRKSSRSKSPAVRPKASATEQHQTPAGPVDSTAEFGPSGGHHLLQPMGPVPPFSFMGSLQNLTQLGMGNLGLKFEGPQGTSDSQLGFGNQPHQLPSLSGFGAGLPSSSVYPFQNEGAQTASFSKDFGFSQLPVVKTEENSRAVQLNLSKELVGVTENVGQFWNGNTAGTNGGLWSDLSRISSSSSGGHIL